MRIFYTPRNGLNGSLVVRKLLKYAYFEMYGENMPDIDKTNFGKPFFPEKPNVHFSLSHTDDFVMCALGEYDIGVDIQTIRQLPLGLDTRVCTEAELSQLDFFSLWTLKESFIKLFGETSLSYRDITFSVLDKKIVCFNEAIRCALYDDIPSCVVAAACFGKNLPVSIEFISDENLDFST